MNLTNIGWTGWSSNFVRYRDPDDNVVHACVKVSPGCGHCYSETLAPRWGRKGRAYTQVNMDRLTPFFDMTEARRVLRSKLIAGKRMFPNDMTDWMGPWLPDDIIDHCVALFALRPDVTFQTLTKHADRQLSYFAAQRYDEINEAARAICNKDFGAVVPTQKAGMVEGGLPLPNLHLGVSAEDQHRANERVPMLRHTRAATRFVSFEPLLGAIDDLSHVVGCHCGAGEFAAPEMHHATCPERFRIHWAIVGAESGAKRREVPIKALTDLVDRLNPHIPVFVKQDGALKPGQQGRIPDLHFIQEFPK